MTYGAAASGGNAFISSSSPGISLMQEGMSFLCSAEVPTVILNVSRGGPGIGGIQPGQADYYQMTRGGGNGDYRIPTFAPASIQEAIDLIYEAVPMADYWQNPIGILTDGILGQMMEPIILPEQRPFVKEEEIAAKKPWAIVGYGNDDSNRSIVKSLRMQPDDLERHVEKLFVKYEQAKKELCRFESIDVEDADLVSSLSAHSPDWPERPLSFWLNKISKQVLSDRSRCGHTRMPRSTRSATGQRLSFPQNCQWVK